MTNILYLWYYALINLSIQMPSIHKLPMTIVNKDHGSSFYKWIELGPLPLEWKNDIEYLKAYSYQKIT